MLRAPAWLHTAHCNAKRGVTGGQCGLGSGLVPAAPPHRCPPPEGSPGRGSVAYGCSTWALPSPAVQAAVASSLLTPREQCDGPQAFPRPPAPPQLASLHPRPHPIVLCALPRQHNLQQPHCSHLTATGMPLWPRQRVLLAPSPAVRRAAPGSRVSSTPLLTLVSVTRA